jgi:hypothetical protein
MRFYISNNEEKAENYLAIPLRTLEKWLEDEYLQEYLIYDDGLDLNTLGIVNQDEGGVWFMSYYQDELFNDYCSFNV